MPMASLKSSDTPKKDPNTLALTIADIAGLAGTASVSDDEVGRDAPHFLAPEPGETEHKPVPLANYDWKVPGKRVMPELERHISEIRAHRAKLTEQAHTVWKWLMVKEAEYYRVRYSEGAVGYDAEQAKKKLGMYCQLLANEHVSLWLAIFKSDWCISDSQKRITQHQQFSRGRYESAGELTPSDNIGDFGFVLSRLQYSVAALKIEAEQHTTTIAMLEQTLKDQKIPDMPEPLRRQFKSASKRDREKMLRGVIEGGYNMRQQTMDQQAVLEEILADGEKKVSLAPSDR